MDEAAQLLPDLAFIDIGMPTFDGNQAVARIRGHRECANAILVALTGFADPNIKEQAYASGFDLFGTKPLNIDKLKQILAILDPKASNLSTAGKVFRLASAWRDSKGA